jgi:hypothetical protein
VAARFRQDARACIASRGIVPSLDLGKVIRSKIISVKAIVSRPVIAVAIGAAAVARRNVAVGRPRRRSLTGERPCRSPDLPVGVATFLWRG